MCICRITITYISNIIKYVVDIRYVQGDHRGVGLRRPGWGNGLRTRRDRRASMPRVRRPVPRLCQGFSGAGFSSACLVAALVALGSGGAVQGQQPAGGRQRSPVVRLAPLEAQRLATVARRSVSAQVAPGLELTAWAPDGLVVDPVALDFDERGALYATSTSRI